MSLRTSAAANAVNSRAAQLFNMYNDNCVCGATRSGRHKFIGLMARLTRSAFDMQMLLFGVLLAVTTNPLSSVFDHFEGKLLHFRRNNCFHPQGMRHQPYPNFYTFQRSRLGHGLNDPAFESRQGQKMFLFSKSSIPALQRTQQHIQWVPGFSPGGAAAGA